MMREGRDSTGGATLHFSWRRSNLAPGALKLLARSLEKTLESPVHFSCENAPGKSERTWRKVLYGCSPGKQNEGWP